MMGQDTQDSAAVHVLKGIQLRSVFMLRDSHSIVIFVQYLVKP